jgi:outer membrane lipoprotein-sorting protein
MKLLANLPRGVRWAVPAAITVMAGGVLAASTIPAAAAPALPPRTPAWLLAAVAAKTPATPMSGTVVETASLGLPALPSIMGTISLPSMLAGSHTINVWYADPGHYRIAIPQSMSESDLIADGSNLWLWGSSADLVTHMTLPAAGKTPAVPPIALTPQQAADQVLAKVGPTTALRVDSNVTVAGEPAYQLVLVPKSPGSLIGQVRIAIDARRSVPLRVQVFAKDAVSPAFEIGFTSVSFVKPAAGDFAFRPPAGATVVQQKLVAGSNATGGSLGTDLTGGFSVAGNGWLAVADLPESALSSLSGPVRPVKGNGSAVGPLRSSSESAAPASRGSGGAALGIGTDVIFNAMLQSARYVSGSWGSGHLLQTRLISMLVTSNGRVLIGAVTPNVLYQAAAQAAHAPAVQWRHTAAKAKSK